MSFFGIVLTLFLVANPIGNAPAVIALVKDFDFDRQKKIILRESLLALFLALFFQYFGQVFLGQLQISLYALRMSGGILLLLFALGLIFSPFDPQKKPALKKEPFFVPIATPLITGPAILAIIMVVSGQMQDHLFLSSAIVTAWIGITVALLAAPYLNRILKTRGLAALSQFMGLFLTLMAVGMLVQGVTEFLESVDEAPVTLDMDGFTTKQS